jgi:hypothetical protein
MALGHYFLLGDVAFGEAGAVLDTAATRKYSLKWDFFFVILLLYASVMPLGHCDVADAGCN